MNILKPRRVLGVDSQTHGMAYALLDDGNLIDYGYIQYEGKEIQDKLKSAYERLLALKAKLKYDALCIESTVTVRSASVAIKMGYFAGVAMAVLGQGKYVTTVSPLTWQNKIGNKTLTSVEKAGVKKSNPGRKTSWYTNEYRRIRKQRTMDWVKKTFDVNVDRDDISDAIGIAFSAGGNNGKA
jgi:Holliday junction resolvasome RuvABC endonuclease subunit